MKIAVNNGGAVTIEPRKGEPEAVTVTYTDNHGEPQRRDAFTAGEIIAALNLLQYMRDYGHSAVYLRDGNNFDYFPIF
jgi:hypothetical protein